MTDPYHTSQIYPASAPEVFAHCLDCLRTIGAKIERSDPELGLIQADYLVNLPLVHASHVSLYLLIVPQDEQRCELTIETFGMINQLDRSRPLHKPREVAQQVLSRVGDTVRQHRD
ncbi:hypothetical protein TFLX_01667 [Thermoflexales bacterium]|nr:hypothetical protein TFLX_01667 [Thermoflexales bacterium]